MWYQKPWREINIEFLHDSIYIYDSHRRLVMAPGTHQYRSPFVVVVLLEQLNSTQLMMVDMDETTDTQDEQNETQQAADTMTTTTDEEKDHDENDEIDCPLFMDRLPQDFASNPHLAAIASLLEDDPDVDPVVTDEKVVSVVQQPFPKRAGGKIARSKSNREQRRAEPYSTSGKGKKEASSKTTTGDVQLFLKMWKL